MEKIKMPALYVLAKFDHVGASLVLCLLACPSAHDEREITQR